MGVGKSSIGLKAALDSGIPFIDLDAQIVKKKKKSISDIFKESGENGFRTLEKKYLREIDFGVQPYGLVSTGGGTPAYFDNASYMNESGTMVWLDTPFEIITARLKEEQEHRPLLEGVPTDNLLQHIKSIFLERKPFYQQAKYKIDNSGYDYEAVETLKQIIQEIKQNHPKDYSYLCTRLLLKYSIIK